MPEQTKNTEKVEQKKANNKGVIILANIYRTLSYHVPVTSIGNIFKEFSKSSPKTIQNIHYFKTKLSSKIVKP